MEYLDFVMLPIDEQAAYALATGNVIDLLRVLFHPDCSEQLYKTVKQTLYTLREAQIAVDEIAELGRMENYASLPLSNKDQQQLLARYFYLYEKYRKVSN